MDTLILTLNHLQDVFSTIGQRTIDLPQIVVVGCQSAGKSSVLEAIVQHDILPRGSGICTRVPLILQLIHINDPKAEWGEFTHSPGKKFQVNEISKEIEAETDRICGKAKNVKDKPITLKFFSAKVLNLTLVDLPGLTKIAVEDQPKDIPQQIERMVMSYITPENAIILAITPGNTDLANSDSLIAAQKVDKNGDRTIGVITKLDIMDKGTDARDVLLNKVSKLKLGYIGVVNRSQADIQANKKVVSAAGDEMKFFKNHPAYSDIADTCGTPYLSRTLNEILMKHIKKQLPSLHQKVNQELAKRSQELETYGSSLGNTQEERQIFLFKLVSHYVDELEGMLHGNTEKLENTRLDGGAMITATLIDDFPQKMLQIESVKDIPTSKVELLVETNKGLGSMFFPEQAFHTLVKIEIEKLRKCATDCIDTCRSQLFDIVSKIDIPELVRFRSLKDNIVKIAQEIIFEKTKKTTEFSTKMIDIQKAYINVNHPDLRGKSSIDLSQAIGKGNVQSLVDLVHRYYVLVRKELSDSIPKAIQKMLILDSLEEIRPKVVSELVLSNPDLLEDPVTVEKRKNCETIISALKKSQLILSEVRKTHIY